MPAIAPGGLRVSEQLVENVSQPEEGAVNQQPSAGRGKSNLRWIVIVVVLAGVVAAYGFNFLGLRELIGSVLGRIQSQLLAVLAWIQDQGAAGPAIFIGVYIVATVLFLPGSVLTLGAGLLFGLGWGTVWVSIASVSGAVCAFLVGRYLARGWVEKRAASYPKFRAVDEAVADEGWKIVALTRLSPAFPFVFLNYAYGLTQVKLSHYFLASWIFMIPGTVMYVYFGSLAGDLATLGTGQRERTPAEWALLIVGLVATVAVTVYVTKIAKRALAKRVEDDAPEKEPA